MIGVTQDEAFYLREHGRGDDVHVSSRTHKSRSKRYFVTESYKTMALLKKYRSQHIIEVHEAEGR